MALVLLMLLFSVLGLRQFINLSLHNIPLSLIIPLLIGSIGVFMNFIVGELDRKKLVKIKSDRPYKFSFILSLGIIIFAIVLGGFMNPQSLSNCAKYTAIHCCWGSCFCFSRDRCIDLFNARFFNRQQERATHCVTNS